MFEYLENLRQKPDKAKKRFAFVVALTFSGIIFVIWLSVIFPKWKSEQDKEKADVISETTPGSTITNIFSEGFSTAWDLFGKLKESILNMGGSGNQNGVEETQIQP